MPSMSLAQVSFDTTRGIVGDELILKIRIIPVSNSKNTVMSGELKLSNPTVFFPDSLASADNFIFKDTLNRINDSTYYFSFEISGYQSDQNELIVCLYGEALAGNDTICKLSFTKLLFNGFPVSDKETIVLTNAVGSQIPYIRVIRLEQNYPNPVYYGNSTKWVYYLDVESRVVFSIFNSLMQDNEVLDLGFQQRGRHELDWTPPGNISSGLYWMFIITNYSIDFKNFTIIK
jgi:hypothetical protein